LLFSCPPGCEWGPRRRRVHFPPSRLERKSASLEAFPLLYSFIFLFLFLFFFYASSSLCVCVLISLLELNLHHGDILSERERERENAVSIEKGGEIFR
jgi:hypothetical protein